MEYQLHNRILIMSDIHLCHMDFFDLPARIRLENMISQLQTEYEKDPYDLILFLGDFSLDFWAYQIGGSFLNEPRVSNTANLFRDYFCRLPVPFYPIPGNHEQYAPEIWKRITGFDRFHSVVYGDFVFVMLDSFSGDLGPTRHSDGTYEPTDTAFVRKVMAEHPGKKFFLCAHHFSPRKESQAFKDLLGDPDVLCLFSGHTHDSDILSLGADFHNKCLLHTGNFSYSAPEEDEIITWGYRELRFFPEEKRIESEYILPEIRLLWDNKTVVRPAGRRDGIVLVI